jgi:hypothetical protein
MRQQQAHDTPTEVVNQHQAARRLGHVPKEIQGLFIVQVMKKERTNEDVVVRGKRFSQRIELEKPNVAPFVLCLLASVGNGARTQVAAFDAKRYAGTAGFVPETDRHVTGARGDVQDT